MLRHIFLLGSGNLSSRSIYANMAQLAEPLTCNCDSFKGRILLLSYTYITQGETVR